MLAVSRKCRCVIHLTPAPVARVLPCFPSGDTSGAKKTVMMLPHTKKARFNASQSPENIARYDIELGTSFNFSPNINTLTTALNKMTKLPVATTVDSLANPRATSSSA